MSSATVVAKGKLTRYRDVNYLSIESFGIPPHPKTAEDAKPKADVPAKKDDTPVVAPSATEP